MPAGELLLDRPAARRVIKSRGESQGSVIRQREYILHQPFSEGRLPDDGRAIVVLQSTRDDLGCAGRLGIHQDRQSERIRTRFFRRVDILALDTAALYA